MCQPFRQDWNPALVTGQWVIDSVFVLYHSTGGSGQGLSFTSGLPMRNLFNASWAPEFPPRMGQNMKAQGTALGNFNRKCPNSRPKWGKT